jgi:bacillopeptidase F (M6 metalloprotease family)
MCGSAFMEYGVKMQIVSGVRKMQSALQKYSIPFNTNSTNHYAKGGPKKHTKPAKQVNFDEAVMKWYVDPCWSSMTIRGIDKICC